MARKERAWVAHGEEALGVFREEVEFEVREIARGFCAQVRHREGVGDDPDGETRRADFGDGEADAINRDGAFARDVAREG